MKEASKKSIYIWNAVGSMSNALSSVILLMLVSRTLTEAKSDTFATAFSISQLMATIGAFKVRMFQATDVKEQFTFNDYFIFRLMTCALMLVVSVGYVVINGYAAFDSIIILILCIYRGADCISDVYHGFFQQRERLDLSGKAITIKAVLPTLCFGIGLQLTGDLLVSTLLLLAAEVILLYAYDYVVFKKLTNGMMRPILKIRHIEMIKIKKLCIKCLPLFINSYLIMDIFTIPKIIIDDCVVKGVLETGSQTYYNILFMPASVMTLIIIVFRPLMTKMANYRTVKNTKAIIKTIVTIFISVISVGALCILVAYFLGIPVLSILYKKNIGEMLLLRPVLLVILLGGICNSLSYVLDDTITIYRRHKYSLIAYGITWLIAKFSAEFLIHRMHLLGAGISYSISMLALLIMHVVILIVCIKKDNKEIGVLYE